MIVDVHDADHKKSALIATGKPHLVPHLFIAQRFCNLIKMRAHKRGPFVERMFVAG